MVAEAKLPGVLALAVSLWVMAYFVLAPKRVYDAGWVDTLVRGTTALVLNIGTFLVAASFLVYALLEL